MQRLFAFLQSVLGICLFPSIALGVHLKIVRPEPGESLTLSTGRTFVAGTVWPANASVTCNGEACDVDEDGAFYGFVPIRSGKETVEIDGKACDAPFEFVARDGEEEEHVSIPTRSPQSPSSVSAQPESFEKPQAFRVTRDLWIGLEGERLGQLIYLPIRTGVWAHSRTGEHYRCRLGGSLRRVLPEVTIAQADLEAIDESDDEPVDGGYFLRPTSSGGMRVFDGVLSRPEGERAESLAMVGEIPSEAMGGTVEAGRTSQGWMCVVTPAELFRSAADSDKPLEGIRVCLDPGHHPDRGAVGPRGFEERESVLLLAREVARQLEKEGAKVSLTREEEGLPLKERHARIRALKPDLVLSLHNNSVGDGQDARKCHGTQTFYLHPWSKPFAEAVHQAMVREMETSDRGCIKRNLYIPRYLGCPVILVEPEYIILPGQEKRFMDSKYRERLAGALVEGIRNFIKEKNRKKESRNREKSENSF